MRNVAPGLEEKLRDVLGVIADEKLKNVSEVRLGDVIVSREKDKDGKDRLYLVKPADSKKDEMFICFYEDKEREPTLRYPRRQGDKLISWAVGVLPALESVRDQIRLQASKSAAESNMKLPGSNPYTVFRATKPAVREPVDTPLQTLRAVLYRIADERKSELETGEKVSISKSPHGEVTLSREKGNLYLDFKMLENNKEVSGFVHFDDQKEQLFGAKPASLRDKILNWAVEKILPVLLEQRPEFSSGPKN